MRSAKWRLRSESFAIWLPLKESAKAPREWVVLYHGTAQDGSRSYFPGARVVVQLGIS